jgi:hypothetical protein
MLYTVRKLRAWSQCMLTQGQRNDSSHPGERIACWPSSETKWISTLSLVKPKALTFDCMKSFYEKGGECEGRYVDKLGSFLDNSFDSVSKLRQAMSNHCRVWIHLKWHDLQFNTHETGAIGQMATTSARREETSSVCGIICGVLHSYKDSSGLTSWHSACNLTQRKKRRVWIQWL